MIVGDARRFKAVMLEDEARARKWPSGMICGQRWTTHCDGHYSSGKLIPGSLEWSQRRCSAERATRCAWSTYASDWSPSLLLSKRSNRSRRVDWLSWTRSNLERTDSPSAGSRSDRNGLESFDHRTTSVASRDWHTSCSDVRTEER